MLKNNSKITISKYFLLSVFVICLIFTSSGLDMSPVYAVDIDDNSSDLEIELDAQDKLENSQIENEPLGASFNDNEILGATKTLNGGSFKDIQSAIYSSNAGDVIKLSGTFYDPDNFGRITVNKPLTITSDSQAILDSQKKSSILYINANARGSVISNLRFVNGIGECGGAILIWSKDITVDNCVFENNFVNNAGGAIASKYDSDVPSNAVVKNCRFYNNGAKIAGGGLTLFGDNSRVENCIFDTNYASNNEGLSVYGGAIQLSLDEVPCVAYAINCVFINNWARSNSPDHSHGGAGCVRDGVSYIGCTFTGNSAGEGGALTFHASGTVQDCTFNDNIATEYGGAISTGFSFNSMNFDILNCKFNRNNAPVGGALQLFGENIHIENTDFNDNYATRNGGAVNIEATTTSLTNDNFNRNVAGVDGGAVYIKGKNSIIQDSTFDSNQAIPDYDKLNDGLGGAVYVDSTNANILNNVFKYNTARNGSAIYYDKEGINLKVLNNVMQENQAWVYALPIYAEDIYFEDTEKLSVIIHGGNNIARYGDLDISNAIYNAARNEFIIVDYYTPVDGATDSGELYQDDREYHIDILLTVEYEDGTVIYNNTLKTNYLGEIGTVLKDLIPGKYYVTAKHFEDTYYKAITNVTSFIVHPKVDNQITINPDKTTCNFEDVVVWTINITNNGPNNATGVFIGNLLPEGLIYFIDDSRGLYDPQTGILNVSTLDVDEKLSFKIVTIVNKTGEVLNKANITSNEFDTNMDNNFDEKFINVNPAADIEVIKTVNATAPNYHDLVNWTILIRNNGPDIAHNITVHDVVPNTLIPILFSDNYNSKSGTWNIESLDVGDEFKFNIISIVDTTGLIENNANAYAVEFDYDLSNNNDNEMIKINPASDLSIIKVVNASVVNYLDIVKWTLTITNNGPDNATGVKITDILPEGFTYLNSTLTYEDDCIDIGNLDVGKTIIIDIICKVEITGNHTNYANISGNEYDHDLTNNEDNVTITVNPACDLEIDKIVNNSEPKYGEQIIWTITVKNNGPDVAHDIKVNEILPNSLIWLDDDSLGDYNPRVGIWNIEMLDVDEEITLNIICQVNKTGITVNNVNVTAVEYDYNLTNNKNNESIEVEPTADVNIIKMVNNTNPNYNDLVKWTIIVSNNGPDKANGVEVLEQIHEGLILLNSTPSKGIYDNDLWFVCCLEKGESQTLEIICRVNKTGNFTNDVNISAEEYDPNLSDNKANESIEVPPAVDIEVIQNVDNPTPLFGDKIVWKIIIKNNGPDNATQVQLTDILPESLIFVSYDSSNGKFEDDIWNVGDLNIGGVEYLNITCIANEIGMTVNHAQAISFEYDWNESNNYDDASINVLPVVDLAVEKLVDNSNPNYLDTITWTLKISNYGPNDASNVMLYDIIPEGLEFITSSDNENFDNGMWFAGSLENGQSKELTIKCKVVSTGVIKNIAEVWCDDYDPNTGNNHAEKSISVSPASDLEITKIASKYNYAVGEVIEYMVEILNNGPDTAYNIKVNEILDKLLKLKSFKVTKGKFNKFTNVWTIDKLGYGESARLYIKAIATGSGIVKNTVYVTSDSFDYDMSNNRDFAIVKVSKNNSDNSIDNPRNNYHNLNKNSGSILEKHMTANPFMILVSCMVFLMIFLGNGISKKR